MIRLKGLRKSLGGQEVLRGIEFEVRRGEVLGLLGHNGAGKTTTLRLLATLLEPSEGEIEIADPDITYDAERLGYKRRIGYLPDEPFLFPYLTGREMLRFVAALYELPQHQVESRVSRFLALLEMTAQADQLTRTYSRGTARKLSILVSILHDPIYWFLDEPTESLDPAATRVLKDLFSQFKARGAGVLISTHQLQLAESLCDRIVILQQGSVAFEGPIADLIRRAGRKLSSLEDLYLGLFHGSTNPRK